MKYFRRVDVVGPIDGDSPPWGDPGRSATEAGYLVEEYQLEGTTVAYDAAPGTRLEADGRWLVAVVAEGRYRTRLLVVRPAHQDEFNGTVLLNWQNVSAGAEPGAPRRGELYRGYAWVGVSAQEVGLYGLPFRTQRVMAGRNRPLLEQDPQRYGELHHPGDQGSFEIFSQAARAVGPQRSVAIDPLGGLEVKRIVATGASQSAMRLAAYINAVQERDHAVDGFVLSLWEGRAPALHDGPVNFGGMRTTIRSDVTAPVLIVNSEFEALGVHSAGAIETSHIRVWEVAGTPHAPTKDRGPEGSGWRPNPLSIGPVHEAALRRAHLWLATGAPAPSQPRIAIYDGSPPAIHRDDLGNAVGGIRLPEVHAPTAEYRGMSFGTGRPPMFGASRRFPERVIRALYPTKAAFLDRWMEAVDTLLSKGVILEEDAPDMRARGETTSHLL